MAGQSLDILLDNGAGAPADPRTEADRARWRALRRQNEITADMLEDFMANGYKAVSLKNGAFYRVRPNKELSGMLGHEVAVCARMADDTTISGPVTVKPMGMFRTVVG